MLMGNTAIRSGSSILQLGMIPEINVRFPPGVAGLEQFLGQPEKPTGRKRAVVMGRLAGLSKVKHRNSLLGLSRSCTTNAYWAVVRIAIRASRKFFRKVCLLKKAFIPG
jgi:hypothetical protein